MDSRDNKQDNTPRLDTGSQRKRLRPACQKSLPEKLSRTGSPATDHQKKRP
jgi:hypothetical protein